MKSAYILASLILLASCGGSPAPASSINPDTASSNVVLPVYPSERKTVKKEPIAIYTEKIKNPLNDWRFQVKILETPQTFRFLLNMEYEEMNEQDTLKIPNLGFEPKLEIRKGEEQHSCIIGFIDNKNQFREYKKVIATNNRLRVITLKRYGVYYK